MPEFFADSTGKKYAKDFIKWKTYCDYFDIATNSLTTVRARRFIAWLARWYPHKTGEVIGRHLTGVTSMMATLDIIWNRPRSITMLLTSLRKRRPVIRRPKRPWSIFHTKLTRKLAVTDFWQFACYAATLLGAGALMRISEFCKTSSKRSALSLGQLDMRDREAYITIDYSKTNQFGRKEIINVPCLCSRHTKRLFGHIEVTPDICPFHVLRSFVHQRNARFGTDPKLPLLLKSNGNPVNAKNLRVFMHSAIDAINAHLNIALDPRHYPSHCLRVGGTTDYARSGYKPHTIKTMGRWLSDLWQKTYMSHDFSDIALLSGLTTMLLREQAL